MHPGVRVKLKWQEGAGGVGVLGREVGRQEGAGEEEKCTNGDSLGWVVLEFSARALAANVVILLTHTHTRTHTQTHTPPHAGQVAPAYIHGLALLLLG